MLTAIRFLRDACSGDLSPNGMGRPSAQHSRRNGGHDLRVRRCHPAIHCQPLLRTTSRPRAASTLRLVETFQPCATSTAFHHHRDYPQSDCRSHPGVLLTQGVRRPRSPYHSDIRLDLLRHNRFHPIADCFSFNTGPSTSQD